MGNRFVGTMDGCGVLLERLVAAPDVHAEARRVATEHKDARIPVPGFGHPQHKPDDPRSIRLLEVARETGVAGKYVRALEALGRAVDEAFGKHITINATGAVAALLGDCGVPQEILRGFAVVARAPGSSVTCAKSRRSPRCALSGKAPNERFPTETRTHATRPTPIPTSDRAPRRETV